MLYVPARRLPHSLLSAHAVFKPQLCSQFCGIKGAILGEKRNTSAVERRFNTKLAADPLANISGNKDRRARYVHDARGRA